MINISLKGKMLNVDITPDLLRIWCRFLGLIEYMECYKTYLSLRPDLNILQKITD